MLWMHTCTSKMTGLESADEIGYLDLLLVETIEEEFHLYLITPTYDSSSRSVQQESPLLHFRELCLADQILCGWR